MQSITPSPEASQPRPLRATIEIIGGELKIYVISDNDEDERRILDALRFVIEDLA